MLPDTHAPLPDGIQTKKPRGLASIVLERFEQFEHELKDFSSSSSSSRGFWHGGKTISRVSFYRIAGIFSLRTCVLCDLGCQDNATSDARIGRCD